MVAAGQANRTGARREIIVEKMFYPLPHLPLVRQKSESRLGARHQRAGTDRQNQLMLPPTLYISVRWDAGTPARYALSARPLPAIR